MRSFGRISIEKILSYTMDSKYKPLHHPNGAGQYSISIPYYGFYNIIIESATSYKFKEYKKINGFVLFRSTIQKLFAKNVGYSSRKASKIWKAADKEFKDIFANIAREITLQMEKRVEFKHFTFPTKTNSGSKPPKNKFRMNSKSFTKPPKQELITGNHCQDDVNVFSFTSHP